MPNPGGDEAVIYFDGVCNLCNRFVDFVIRHDLQRRFRFASLQGETARERLPGWLTGAALRTVALETPGRLRFRSDAVLAVLAGLGGAWKLAAGFRIVPPIVRDAVYEYVANRRFRWFGQRDSCRLPTPEERELFLP